MSLRHKIERLEAVMPRHWRPQDALMTPDQKQRMNEIVARRLADPTRREGLLQLMSVARKANPRVYIADR